MKGMSLQDIFVDVVLLLTAIKLFLVSKSIVKLNRKMSELLRHTQEQRTAQTEFDLNNRLETLQRMRFSPLRDLRQRDLK